jgi:hypothetical protein
VISQVVVRGEVLSCHMANGVGQYALVTMLTSQEYRILLHPVRFPVLENSARVSLVRVSLNLPLNFKDPKL